MTDTTKKPLLYTYCNSSCSWRVRIGLNYKGIAYDAVYINLYAGEGDNQKPEYKALNPIGHVPALIIDDHLLLESMNILHYLEETRPQNPLMPKDPWARAQVRVICEILTTAIQPLQNKTVLMKVGDADKKLEWAVYFITRGFRALEKIISRSAGKYCVGDEITLADCSLVPQVYGARVRFHMDLSEFPQIVRIDALLADHPAFVAGHAENQPDFP